MGKNHVTHWMSIRRHIVCLAAFLAIVSCEPLEEQVSSDTGLALTVSTDTIQFDTLLTDTLSLTRRFRVYNPNKQAVAINSIRLGKGNTTGYQIVVNGKNGPEVNDQVLFGGDSLMVLVSIDIDAQDQNNPYLVKDSVIVDWNGNLGHVKLIAWGQDANYYRNRIICDEVWTADRPYVIQNAVIVDSLCTLTVMPGTEIYLDNGAAFFVQGTLKILGDSTDRVTIRNTRFDENYLEAPGQWDAIYFLEGSKDNEIHYADIENGSVGLRVGSPDPDTDFDLVVSHTSIRHMFTAGILAFSSDIYGYNVEIYNVSNYLVGNFAGGNYRYEHCTFTNSPSFFISDEPSVQFSDNIVLDNGETLVDDLTISLINNIVWGGGKEELLINNGGGTTISLVLESNIIRSEAEIPDNYTSLESNFPGFKDSFAFDYRLDSLAFAQDKASPIGIETDLNGVLRDDAPDIGAYERKKP